MKSKLIQQDVADSYPSPSLAWYVTILLTVVFILSFVDRQILNLLVEPIQEDLGLTDTQFSLLQGFAFVGANVFVSIPLGRLVDTKRRTFIIAGGIFVWSLATAACGMARSFIGLFVARAGVGIGEATLTPGAWSLLADYFPLNRRTVPFSIFLMGPYLGVGVAMIAGGFLMDTLTGIEPLPRGMEPWQLTFIIVAAPGLIFSLLVALVPEPSRKGILLIGKQTETSLSHLVEFIRRNARIYIALLIGSPCIIMLMYGLQAWIPTYLLRVHGMSLSEAGTEYGLIAIFSGSAGVLSGPLVGKIFVRWGYPDFQLRIPGLVLVLVIPNLIMLALSENALTALVFIAIISFLVPLPLSLVATALQAVTPNHMRGVIIGVYVVTGNLLGLGLGPTLVALSTDYIFTDPTAVGMSLALVGSTIAILGFCLFWRGLETFNKFLTAETSAAN